MIVNADTVHRKECNSSEKLNKNKCCKEKSPNFILNQIINMPKGNRKPFYLEGFIAPALYFSKGYSLFVWTLYCKIFC